jgi:hypothetical protein
VWARLAIVVLAVAAVSLACGGGTGGDASPVATATATLTPTPGPTVLTVASTPPGANVEVNPQKSATTGDYVPGTGRSLGTTPVTARLQPGDFVVDGGCATLLIYVWERVGYYGAVDNISACVPTGASGPPVPQPSYSWTATLAPCPADVPLCGMPSG